MLSAESFIDGKSNGLSWGSRWLEVEFWFNRAPAFDGSSNLLSSFFFSPYGHARLASYYISLKRGF